MPKPAVKSKIKPKTKPKTKAKVAPKAKAKPKLKAKSKVAPKAKAKTVKAKAVKAKKPLKAKAIAKPKKALIAKKTTAPKKVQKIKKTAKPKASAAVKATPKAKPKANVAVKAKPKAQPKAKPKSKTIKIAETGFSQAEKETLLELIEKVVHLRKRNIYGLKSFDAIDHILDKHNQKFTDTHAKFDAIVELGMLRHKRIVSGLIAVSDEGRDAVILYHLLMEIGKGGVTFSEINDKMHSVLEEAIEIHRTMGIYT